MSTIFVTIPAYEDPLLIETIEGALSMAKDPQNIKFAIALQYDKCPTPDLSKYNNQAFIVSYNVDSRPGVNYIRSELLKFYNDEDYFLMIDSHMNFAKNWDKDLIDLLNFLGPKAIISKQVSDKAGDISMHENLIKEETTWFYDEDEPGGLSGRLKACPKPSNNSSLIYLTRYASFHFFFTYGHFIKEVGISKIHNHYAEESLLSYQAFLCGWDIYASRNYNHIGHNDIKYNLSLLGEEYPSKTKSWGVLKDSQNLIDELNLYFLNSTITQFNKNNQVRTTFDFYESIGLAQLYQELLQTPHL